MLCKTRNRKCRFVFALWLCSQLAAIVPTAQAEYWPGPPSDGSSMEKDMPTNWDPANATWKTELSGQRHASPIVRGDRI